MILLSIFQSVEFYVIAVVAAAAIVAFMSVRQAPGPVRTILLGSTLSTTGNTTPAIELECLDDGSVMLTRHGVAGVTEAGAVSAAITVKGFDVKIEERIVAGNPAYSPADTATFLLDFMGAEHYFISYVSQQADLFAAVTLHNRPGIKTRKALQ